MTEPMCPRSQDEVGSSSGSGASQDEGDGSGVNAQGGALLSIPMDLMFEIAGHLTLKDLIALSDTSEALRARLNSPQFSVAWTAARRAAQVPDCPPGFSEPRWAIFLYGSPTCEWCGAEGVHHAEIHVQRRICARCKRRFLLNTVELPQLFPNFNAAVLDMVPSTSSGGWIPNYGYEDNFFWSSDIRDVGAEWALLQGDVQAHVEGAEERAAAYRAERVLEVKRIKEYANKFKYAVREIGMESLTGVIDRRMSRFDAIRARLLALGYDSRDISYAAFIPPEFHQGAELTDESWVQMQPRAVALVESRRDARLGGDRVLLRLRRIKALHTLYLDYTRSLAPREWSYLPSIYELVEFPVFKAIVEADGSVEISPDTLSAAQLPTMISEWISAKKARVTAMLGPRPGMVSDPLDLATSVFECTSSGCVGGVSRYRTRKGIQCPLISWEVIAAHSCQPVGRYKSMFYTPTSVGVSHLGGVAAATLVQGAGLDPASATISQMDALDLRFACLECPPLYKGHEEKEGYPWKFAVEHGMTTQHATWHRMSSDEEERVKAKEGRRGSFWDWEASWSCNHCAHHLNRWRMKDKVLWHLVKVHQIMSPTEPADLFCYPGYYPVPQHRLGSTKFTERAPTDVADV